MLGLRLQSAPDVLGASDESDRSSYCREVDGWVSARAMSRGVAPSTISERSRRSRKTVAFAASILATRVTDGGFRPDGTFVRLPLHDVATLTEAFRRAVLKRFVRRELMEEATALGMLAWPHAGFHVHDGVWLPADDRPFAIRLARYCARQPVALSRLAWTPARSPISRIRRAAPPRAPRPWMPSSSWRGW